MTKVACHVFLDSEGHGRHREVDLGPTANTKRPRRDAAKEGQVWSAGPQQEPGQDEVVADGEAAGEREDEETKLREVPQVSLKRDPEWIWHSGNNLTLNGWNSSCSKSWKI